MAELSIERSGLPEDPDYLAEIAIKIGYGPAGDQHNLTLLDKTAEYLHLAGQEIPEELELRRSQLEARWLEGRLIRWLDLPAPHEPAEALGKCSMRLARLLEQSDDPQNVVFITAPMRNELAEIDKFFGALTAQPLQTPVAAVVVGDSLSSDGSVVETLLRHKANIGRSSRRGIGPARRAALQHIRNPEVARTRLQSEKEFYLVTDTDSTVEPGLTDTYVRAFREPANGQRMIATGEVEYTFLWPDRPKLVNGEIVVPDGLPAGSHYLFDARSLANMEKYIDGDRVVIHDFPSYQFFTANASISQLFSSQGLDMRDFIVGGKCRMLPGPNTCIRGSFLDLIETMPEMYQYPLDGRHEQLHVSIAWQNLVDFEEVGIHLKNANVLASERGIVGPQGYVLRHFDELPRSVLTTRRLLDIWSSRGVKPYKIELGEGVIDAEKTISLVVSGLRQCIGANTKADGRR